MHDFVLKGFEHANDVDTMGKEYKIEVADIIVYDDYGSRMKSIGNALDCVEAYCTTNWPTES